MSETELSKSIRSALEVSGWWVMRLGVNQKRGARGSQSGEPGCPDLMLLGPWSFGFLEVKTATGKLSPEQTAWHARALRSGLRVATVRSVREAMRVAWEWRQG